MRIVGSDIAHAVPLMLVAGGRSLGAWLDRLAAARLPAGRLAPRHRLRQLRFGPSARLGAAPRAHGGSVPGGAAVVVLTVVTRLPSFWRLSGT